LSRKYEFVLDESRGVVWVIFQDQEKKRINCSPKLSMIINACLFFAVEFPRANPEEVKEFRQGFSGFYESNREKIESEALENKYDLRDLLVGLDSEVKKMLSALSDRDLLNQSPDDISFADED